FLLTPSPHPSSPLFPYTTLFRSWQRAGRRRTSLLLEHLQHAVCDEESTDDVGHGGEQRDGPENPDGLRVLGARDRRPSGFSGPRSEEHTSELQSRFDLVCRLLLE